TKKSVDEKKVVDLTKFFRLFQLKYALNPESKENVQKLAQSVYEDLKEEDTAISSLAEGISENKDSEEALKALVESLLSIIYKKELGLSPLKKKK
ncbi:unnamed protein product, partial [marine sediment metagenome]